MAAGIDFVRAHRAATRGDDPIVLGALSGPLHVGDPTLGHAPLRAGVGRTRSPATCAPTPTSASTRSRWASSAARPTSCATRSPPSPPTSPRSSTTEETHARIAHARGAVARIVHARGQGRPRVRHRAGHGPRHLAAPRPRTAPTSCSALAAPRSPRRWPPRCGRSAAAPRSSPSTSPTPTPARRPWRAAVEALGGLDILVNNAFQDGNRKAFMDAPLEEWRETMDVNLWGTLQMTKAAVPAHDRAGRRLDRDDQLDVDPPDRADLRRLRGVEGRARDGDQDARRWSSGRTASG